MYTTISEYRAQYGKIDEKLFTRLVYEAGRMIDSQTTGIDGVRKLRVAFPSDDYDSEAVRRCAAKVVNILQQIQEAEDSAAASAGYEATDLGLRGKVVSSVTAGNESISYAVKTVSDTVISKAVSDASFRDSLMNSTIWKYLSGVKDANGVNLLYMGAYPRRYLC